MKNIFRYVLSICIGMVLIFSYSFSKKNNSISKSDSIQAINELKNISKHYKTWIRSLPGITAKTGEEVKVNNIILNNNGGGEITIIFKNKHEIIEPLKKLSKSGESITELLLTLRPKPKSEDNCYVLQDLKILKMKDRSPKKTTKPVKYDSVEVTFSFKTIKPKLCGIRVNPGPPSNAPAINPGGMNKGWVHYHYTKNPEEGKPFDVLSYTVHSDKIEIIIKKENTYLFEHVKNLPELILILPNTQTMEYEEYRMVQIQEIKIESIIFRNNLRKVFLITLTNTKFCSLGNNPHL